MTLFVTVKQDLNGRRSVTCDLYARETVNHLARKTKSNEMK